MSQHFELWCQSDKNQHLERLSKSYELVGGQNDEILA